ncbi:PREDICTED: dnaJ homolog subfamily C member 12 [Thamnophis sirtalis]|uniref:DnaJ homolog subfamily C member 12 n=1 Tax=Thamnophis sirtalis TaxID=35019 RepID=A0A6I9XF50_9SAUR|nr:PREDICTED: dnaJ homolog subfamily C member 12 [Thamnophis sirtalis]
MDAIFSCRLEDMEDYYSLLGCDELSTVEQIVAEFKVRALECHPDKHPGTPQAVENFQKLQHAKEILSNEDSRARYDYWRRSKIAIPFQKWEALSNSMKAVSFVLCSHISRRNEPLYQFVGRNVGWQSYGYFLFTILQTAVSPLNLPGTTQEADDHFKYLTWHRIWLFVEPLSFKGV